MFFQGKHPARRLLPEVPPAEHRAAEEAGQEERRVVRLQHEVARAKSGETNAEERQGEECQPAPGVEGKSEHWEEKRHHDEEVRWVECCEYAAAERTDVSAVRLEET